MSHLLSTSTKCGSFENSLNKITIDFLLFGELEYKTSSIFYLCENFQWASSYLFIFNRLKLNQNTKFLNCCKYCDNRATKSLEKESSCLECATWCLEPMATVAILIAWPARPARPETCAVAVVSIKPCSTVLCTVRTHPLPTVHTRCHKAHCTSEPYTTNIDAWMNAWMD